METIFIVPSVTRLVNQNRHISRLSVNISFGAFALSSTRSDDEVKKRQDLNAFDGRCVCYSRIIILRVDSERHRPTNS